MEHHAEKSKLMHEVERTLASDKEISSLLEQAMQMALTKLKASASSILLVEPETGDLFFEAATGEIGRTLSWSRIKVRSGIAAWVTTNCQPVIVNDVSKDPRFHKGIDESFGFTTNSILCVPLIASGKSIGAIEVINKASGGKFNMADLDLLVAMASTAAVAIDNARMRQAALCSYLNKIKMLSETVDARDAEMIGHSKRVARYALIAAVSLDLSPSDLRTIEYAGLLHDAEKMSIDDAILCKPFQLTAGEWEKTFVHPCISANIIADIPILKEIKSCVLHHHERYDGSGYPDKLKGSDIPLGARLLAVADCFDTMTTDRPFLAALSIDAALNELKYGKGTHFCPSAVDAFISGFEKNALLNAQKVELQLS
jgi:HD-GYP domain-containing protein (c-di-GMP phosphodiesterase class II)